MSWIAFINGILLITALTTDSFVVSFSYGAQNVRLSGKIILAMNLVMSLLLAAGIWAGSIIEDFFPRAFALSAGALVLIGMGGYRMFRFFLQEKALEEREVGELDYFQGILLAVLLSLDGVAAGIGTGLVQARAGFLIPGVFLGGVLMMKAGWEAGNHFQDFFQRDISWVSGICLMALGVGTLCKL
ncbi:MAG TPA: manganese efflux pump [Candidatus Blautia avicola]|uniref:Manganese efflux pump n=1 Tax=Candidatus Blautia avicola TaxID=2838483 RepID=A0A9D2TYC5_9FIRM|nr:manganese efflux pump [Candidatus Blautia avicola]